MCSLRRLIWLVSCLLRGHHSSGHASEYKCYYLSTLAPRNYPKHTSSVPGFVDDMSAMVMLLATLPWLARR